MKLSLHLLAIGLVSMALNVGAADKNAPKKEAPQKDKKQAQQPRHEFPTFGSIERLDPALDTLLAPDAKLEKLASGFAWSEGPVWLARSNMLVFSDVKRNIAFRWKEGEKTVPFLDPSGYTGSVVPRPGASSLKDPSGDEPGSNGLTLDSKGRLVLCQHGDRRVARLEPDGKFTTLARLYDFRRFNSPNDLVYKKNGDLYFTDPPYGLVGNTPTNKVDKEILFQGVYRLKPDGKVDLLVRDLTFPNGLAFSPDERKLYVAVSDPAQPNIWVFDVTMNGALENGRIFFNTKPLADKGLLGLPDGMKVDLAGNLWATGPGGVLILSPEGKHLGSILTGTNTANCAWGEDGTVLYICANHDLARIKTLTHGAMPGGK